MTCRVPGQPLTHHSIKRPSPGPRRKSGARGVQPRLPPATPRRPPAYQSAYHRCRRDRRMEKRAILSRASSTSAEQRRRSLWATRRSPMTLTPLATRMKLFNSRFSITLATSPLSSPPDRPDPGRFHRRGLLHLPCMASRGQPGGDLLDRQRFTDGRPIQPPIGPSRRRSKSARPEQSCVRPRRGPLSSPPRSVRPARRGSRRRLPTPVPVPSSGRRRGHGYSYTFGGSRPTNRSRPRSRSRRRSVPATWTVPGLGFCPSSATTIGSRLVRARYVAKRSTFWSGMEMTTRIGAVKLSGSPLRMMGTAFWAPVAPTIATMRRVPDSRDW